MSEKVTLSGKLFILVEDDGNDVSVVAEIGGINIWDWLKNNKDNDVSITLEKNEEKE